MRNVYLSDSKHIHDIKLFVIFGLCSFSEIHGGRYSEIEQQYIYSRPYGTKYRDSICTEYNFLYKLVFEFRDV